MKTTSWEPIIRIIVQGSTRLDRMRKQWGLSLLVGNDVLFDTFSDPETLASNFRKCGVDARQIRHVVISHDHWDHTGGLWWLLEQNRDCTVYVCPRSGDGLKERIRRSAARMVEADGPTAVREGVFTTGEIEGSYAGQPMFEQALVVAGEAGRAVLTGCSHPGVLAMLAKARSMSPDRISLVLGGFHLADASQKDLEAIARALETVYAVDTAAPFHCTGENAVRFFRERMPERFAAAGTGDAFIRRSGSSTWTLQKGGAW